VIEETKEQLRHSLKEISQQSHIMDTSESIPESPSLYQVPAQQVVQMVDNYFDRQRREYSLIVHNLPEGLNDEDQVKEIIEKELEVGRCDIVNMVHLGQSRNSRPRSLLVTLVSENLKWNVLRAVPNLHHSVCFSKVYQSPDLTPKEREVNRKLREELVKRRKDGEKNLVIRRGKIILKEETVISSLDRKI